ncbi:Dabb family protein [Fulvivirgaceae bacterium BMA12]|uniref:Dabb family protein n=1 Tax=Agaribacillus aureus TaxID=3051825 RepID=A0ABT8LCW7_9BACT|nr:Dabb family protein [Fulvivirgaceae bacterium BMA12]
MNVPKVLRHVVSFKFKDDATPEQIGEAVLNFENLPTKIPEIMDFEWGINNSTEGHSKGFTHCFTLTFKDESTRDIYLKHKDHLAFVDKIGLLLADVFVMDYLTGD